VEQLSNGVNLQMFEHGRPIKRRRHDEVQPFLRDFMLKASQRRLPRFPPPDAGCATMACAPTSSHSIAASLPCVCRWRWRRCLLMRSSCTC